MRIQMNRQGSRRSAVMDLKDTGPTQVRRHHFIQPSGRTQTLTVFGKTSAEAQQYLTKMFSVGYHVVKAYGNEIWYKQSINL